MIYIINKSSNENHQNNLIIDSVALHQLTQFGEYLIQITSIDYDKKLEFVILHLNQMCLRNNEYKLIIDYEGIIGDTLVGFYQSSYKDQDGKTQ